MKKIKDCPLVIAQTHGFVMERHIDTPSGYVCHIAIYRKMCDGDCPKKHLT